MTSSAHPSMSTPDVDVAIIGAGFSGLGMAIALQNEGKRTFTVLEKGSDVGGTWYANRYPGCACDVPSNLYSFSFAPNPQWSKAFSPQPEIFQYLRGIADTYDLRKHIRFKTEVAEARFDDATKLWRLAMHDGSSLTARILVSGQGALTIPAYPKIEGLETFGGDKFHSAEWRDDVSLHDKNIAVIGTGASAIQFIPQIAPKAKHLTVFQRTPPWIIPKLDRTISEEAKARFARQPWRQKLWRLLIYTFLESGARNWLKPKGASANEKLARRHLEKHVADPQLRAKLTPDYRIGCKRILLSNDYYPTLCRDNVTLETTAIARVEKDAVILADGRRVPVDVIIYGTGFHVTDRTQDPFDVIGEGGRRLKDDWKDGAEAHLGITVTGYPNYFILMGPNTGLGHNSIIYMIESQIAYIMSALRAMDARGLRTLDAKPQAQAAFVDEINRKVGSTVWSSGCRSWYLSANGRNTTIWPDYTFKYRYRTRKINLADYNSERA